MSGRRWYSYQFDGHHWTCRAGDGRKAPPFPSPHPPTTLPTMDFYHRWSLLDSGAYFHKVDRAKSFKTPLHGVIHAWSIFICKGGWFYAESDRLDLGKLNRDVLCRFQRSAGRLADHTLSNMQKIGSKIKEGVSNVVNQDKDRPKP